MLAVLKPGGRARAVLAMLGLAGYGNSSDEDGMSEDDPATRVSPPSQRQQEQHPAAATTVAQPGRREIHIMVKPARPPPDEGLGGMQAALASPGSTAVPAASSTVDSAAATYDDGGPLNATEQQLLDELGVKMPERNPPKITLEELTLKHLGPEVTKVAAEVRAAADSEEGATVVREQLSDLEKLQLKVLGTLQKYEQGGPHFCEYMRTNHAFRNPEILTKMVETFGIDECASNFSKDLFDPHGYLRPLLQLAASRNKQTLLVDGMRTSCD